MGARAISSVEAPVSSFMRCISVAPPLLTVSLTSSVVTISRRSACPMISSGKRSRSAFGKYAWASCCRYGSSGRAVPISSSVTVILL